MIAILLANTTLVGCWDNDELDTISIATGLGVDAAENEEDVHLILQVGKIKENSGYESGSSQQENSFWVMETIDKGISSAINNLDTESTRTIFLHHNQVIIFGKEQAQKGIKKYVDALSREHQMRMETWVVVADNMAKDILSNAVEQETNSAIGLSKMIETSSRQYESFSVRFIDLISKMMEETTSPIIPIVRAKPEDQNSKFEITGLAIFKDDKYIGKLDLEKVRGYSWIMDRCKKNSLNVTTENGYANMNITNINLKKDPKITEDELLISIDFKGDINVSEMQGFEGMNSNEVFSALKKAGERAIKKEILDCFNYTKELNGDIYGFGTEISRKYPKEWEKMKENWNDLYTELKMEININLTVRDTGKIVKSLDMEERAE